MRIQNSFITGYKNQHNDPKYKSSWTSEITALITTPRKSSTISLHR